MTENKRFTYSDVWGWNIDGFLNVMNGLDRKNNELKERVKELEQEKESWKSSPCHDMNLKSMLAFEIGKLTETKDIEKFLDFYYKHFCKIDGDVDD